MFTFFKASDNRYHNNYFVFAGHHDLHNRRIESRRNQVSAQPGLADLHRGLGQQPQPAGRLSPLGRRTQDRSPQRSVDEISFRNNLITDCEKKDLS